MRGPNLSGVWLDEASLMQEEAFLICIAALREDGGDGFLSATFTPQGPGHWTHETFNTDKPDTEIFFSKTADNTFNSPGFVRRLENQYGDTNWARQELGGEFVQLEGTEFPSHWLTGDIFFDAWPDDLLLKVIALDPSKGPSARQSTLTKKGDFQAHVLIGAKIEDGRWIFYVDAVLERVGVTQMCERTVNLCREFSGFGRRVDSVIVEENGTMGLIAPALARAEAKSNYIIGFTCRNNTDFKEFRIRSQCSPPLSRCQVRFRRTPGARLLVGQLTDFPMGAFDDGPDALAIALKRVAELLAKG
jgi:phage terminase large subunit-like protein